MATSTKKTIKETAAKVADETKKTAAKVKESPAVKKVAEGTKKTATKAKKTVEKAGTKVNTYVEFGGKQIATEELADKVRADYKAKNSKTRIRTIEIYVKPEDNAAYYVINGKAEEGNKIDL